MDVQKDQITSKKLLGYNVRAEKRSAENLAVTSDTSKKHFNSNENVQIMVQFWLKLQCQCNEANKKHPEAYNFLISIEFLDCLKREQDHNGIQHFPVLIL